MSYWRREAMSSDARPALRVIDGGRNRLTDELARLADSLRDLGQVLEAVREELRRSALGRGR